MKFDEKVTEKTTCGGNWSMAIIGGLPVQHLQNEITDESRVGPGI